MTCEGSVHRPGCGRIKQLIDWYVCYAFSTCCLYNEPIRRSAIGDKPVWKLAIGNKSVREPAICHEYIRKSPKSWLWLGFIGVRWKRIGKLVWRSWESPQADLLIQLADMPSQVDGARIWKCLYEKIRCGVWVGFSHPRSVTARVAC